MPENKSNLLDIDALLANIRNIVERYKQEIEQQVKDAQEQTYEDFPINNETSVQSITTSTEDKKEKVKTVGPFNRAKGQKTKVVNDGGKIK